MDYLNGPQIIQRSLQEEGRSVSVTGRLEDATLLARKGLEIKMQVALEAANGEGTDFPPGSPKQTRYYT